MESISSSLERDRQSRHRIVSETDTNMFVEAGAGSGKTTMLVRRMASMVEAGIDIAKICAITFTRAAAGEFYSRFQKMLMERGNPNLVWKDSGEPGQLPRPTEETRERCNRALQNIDLCFMGTIDAFCAMVLSEHPTEAGIPSDAVIISDGDAEMLYKQQYVRICAGELGEELQALAKTFQLLHSSAQDVFVRGLSFVMNNRNVAFRFEEAKDVQIDREFETERKTLIEALMLLIEHTELKYEGNKDSVAAWERIAGLYQSIRGRWSSSFPGVLYALKELGKLRIIPEALSRYEDVLGPATVPGGKKSGWLELKACQEGETAGRMKKLRYDASMTFIMRCVPMMEQALRDRGGLTYFDNLYYLRNMLRRDAEGDGKLIRYIYDRHSYFLIDEFQDTNPMQAEVFFYLTAEEPVPQWSACRPRPGSLFIVGDPKQSIYRFRSADVSSFLKVKQLFEQNGGAILSLSRNFRSTHTLCSYFNRVYSALLPEETIDQSKFEEIPLPEPREDEFQGIFTYTAYTGKAAEENPGQADPVQIANIIEGLAGRKEFKIRGEEDDCPRPIRYSDFMVISFGKNKLRPTMEELSLRGIPTRVEGDVPFAENEALREICRIYSAAADPEDRISLYGALTGKLFAVSDEEILQFRAAGCDVSLMARIDQEDVPNEEAYPAAGAIQKLKELHGLSDRLSPASLFAKIAEEYRIYQKLPTENLEVVCYALELLRNAEKSGKVITLKDGSIFLRDLIDGKSGEERCLRLDAGKDCVHLANLHKVKGLEAPIVILAATPDKNYPAEYRMIHGDDSSTGYLFSLGSERDENGRRKIYFETKDYPEEKLAEDEALKAERQRLIYVAATRARNAVILCNATKIFRGKPSVDSRWKPITETGTSDIFWYIRENSSQDDVAGPPGEETAGLPALQLYKQAEESSALKNRRAENATFRTVTPSSLHLVSKMEDLPGENALPAVEDGPGRQKQFPALLGTMTHKLMEMLVSAGNRTDADAAVGEIIREYRTAETEPYEEELTASLLRVADRMRNGGYPQSNGLPRDILGTLLSADAVYCELPFCYQEENENETVLWNGIMDAVYSENGRWHIVDYKTNADGSDLDRQYQGQLAAYIKAFKATTGQDVDARTYHIDI